jgi:hypothetical protein
MKEIQLTTGQTVIISDEDFQRVSEHNWYRAGKGYAQTSINGENIYLHRFIMGAKPGEEVDHRNGKRNDCQRENLRLCTHSQNMANGGVLSNNKLGVKGVSFHKNKYRAVIQVNRKSIHLGRFDNINDAAHAYDVAASAYFGEFAQLNFPEAIDARIS